MRVSLSGEFEWSEHEFCRHAQRDRCLGLSRWRRRGDTRSVHDCRCTGNLCLCSRLARMAPSREADFLVRDKRRGQPVSCERSVYRAPVRLRAITFTLDPRPSLVYEWALKLCESLAFGGGSSSPVHGRPGVLSGAPYARGLAGQVRVDAEGGRAGSIGTAVTIVVGVDSSEGVTPGAPVGPWRSAGCEGRRCEAVHAWQIPFVPVGTATGVGNGARWSCPGDRALP